MQNVQTLQSLNGETKHLQRKLQHQLKELMLLTLSENEIYPTNNGTDRSHSVSPTLSANGTISPPVLPPFRVSLLSLLADFIDSSCNELRAELQGNDADTVPTLQCQENDKKNNMDEKNRERGRGRGSRNSSSNSLDTDSDGSYEIINSLHIDDDSKTNGAQSYAKDIISERHKRISHSMEKHLGWMRDLRGEKPPTAVHTPRIPTDTGSETDAVEEATVKVDGVDIKVEIKVEKVIIEVEVKVNDHHEGIDDDEPSVHKDEKAEDPKCPKEVEAGVEVEDPLSVPGGVRLALLPDFR